MADRSLLRRSRPVRWAAGIAFLGALALLPSLAGVESVGSSPGDILAFWASARAVLDGLDPYDPAVLERILATAGYEAAPEVYYPPWLFTVILWFGFLNAPAFAATWLFLSLVALVVASHLTIRHFARSGPDTGGSPLARWMPYVFAVSFYPFLLALDLGQLTPVALLGFTGFLILRGRPEAGSQVLAGVALVAAALKPHLIFLVLVDFVIVEARRRRWTMLGSFAAGVAVACIVPVFVEPAIYSHFLGSDGSATFAWFTPTLGAWLEHLAGFESVVLQLTPTALAVGAAALVALTRPLDATRNHEDGRLMLLVVASLLTAPYLWSYDFMLLLPVGVWIIAWDTAGRPAERPALSAVLLVVANVAMLAGSRAMHYQIWYPLLVLALLLIGLRTDRQGVRGERTPEGALQ